MGGNDNYYVCPECDEPLEDSPRGELACRYCLWSGPAEEATVARG